MAAMLLSGLASARICWMRTSSMWKTRSQVITSATALMPQTSSQKAPRAP
jgi:hypothetical protein